MVDKFNFNKCQKKGRIMSKKDRFAKLKDPMFQIFFLAGEILFLILNGWVFDDKLGLSIAISVTIAGFGYMMTSDITKRDTLLEKQDLKDKSIIAQIKSQRSSDLGKGTCISCRADLPDNAPVCPECGFDLTTITKREAKIDRLEKEDEL